MVDECLAVQIKIKYKVEKKNEKKLAFFNNKTGISFV